MGQGHRPSAGLKQTNKKHKGGTASKRAAKAGLGAGRVEGAAAGASGKSRSRIAKDLQDAGKFARANQAKQRRDQKRNAVWLQKRIGGNGAPPKVALWVPLSSACDCAAVEALLVKGAGGQGNNRCVSHEVAGASGSACAAMSTAFFAQDSQRITFLHAKPGDAMAVVELAKVADMVIFVLSVTEGADKAVEKDGDLVLTLLRAQGLPAVVGVTQGLETLTGRALKDMRSYSQRFWATEFPDAPKLADGGNAVQLVRAVTTAPIKPLHWRAIRSYIVTESATVEEGNSLDGQGKGVLKLRGYIRGRPLSVNQLIHVCGSGHYRLRQINSACEPCPIRVPQHREGDMSDEAPTIVLGTSDSSRAETLEMEAPVDHLAGDQTWPTEEELAEAESEQKVNNDEPRPKGWSTYQATWLVPEGGGHGADAGAGGVDDGHGDIMGSEDGEDWHTDSGGDVDDSGSIMDVDKRKDDMSRIEEEDREFPDEVNTPKYVPARSRFDRYRALKSFRTSTWDPKESLPREYARVYQFDDFAAAQRVVSLEGELVEKCQNDALLETAPASSSRSRASSVAPRSRAPSSVGAHAMDIDEDNMHETSSHISTSSSKFAVVPGHEQFVSAGTYVELVIEGVPLEGFGELKGGGAGLLACSLLQFEQKLSVLHFQVMRDARYTEPIPSKERLWVHCGFRKWLARPTFSQLNLNCEKHKFERFLQPDRFCAASVYGPATFQPSPVLLFKEVVGEDGSITNTFVAAGSLLSVDPDRIILKKIMLTGYPIRVHKRRAVVRHMFNFQTDVKWFKPAELSTKYGLSGHIKEPVGTHGLMKVIFNKNIKQNDTVCLPLYKRVYPKLENNEVIVL